MSQDRISRLLDADLEVALVGDALRTLRSDPEAREACTLYQIIGDALRGRPVEDDGYSRRIFAALDAADAERNCRAPGNFSPPLEPI